ncbi:MAG: S-methyl-5'-thioadenosine phosphorylase [Deltaproteobacteria bacterium]|nr:S-methyl-5'-thioadenosine phosphorylase [Deltaproteobacteria bacterium]
MKRVKIGIIGGTGLDDPELLENAREKEVETPYGRPSSSLTTGSIGKTDVVVLARHGKGHSIYPTGVNYRANIYALKQEECTHIIATTAVGSLREKIEPGDIVFPDQFIDFTKNRALTFFDMDKVIHTSMAEPFCANLRNLLIKNAEKLGYKHHTSGTVVTIEGPRFSTKAESHMFRGFGADVINMSTVPEVTLARELGLCYQTIAMSTDYDCWKEGEEPVTWDMIVAIMNKTADKVKTLILKTLPEIKPVKDQCNGKEE